MKTCVKRVVVLRAGSGRQPRRLNEAPESLVLIYKFYTPPLPFKVISWLLFLV
jgi:hypothetical protein